MVGRPALNRHDLDRRPGAAARSRHAPGIQSRRDPSQGRDARFSDLLDHRPRIGGEAVGLLGLRAVTDPADLGQLGAARASRPWPWRLPAHPGLADRTVAECSRPYDGNAAVSVARLDQHSAVRCRFASRSRGEPVGGHYEPLPRVAGTPAGTRGGRLNRANFLFLRRAGDTFRLL